MIIHVKAKPDGCEDKVEKIDATHLVVETREPPLQNRANRAISALIARHFGVALGQVRLIKGFRERSKLFEIR